MAHEFIDHKKLIPGVVGLDIEPNQQKPFGEFGKSLPPLKGEFPEISVNKEKAVEYLVNHEA
jgi:hypothetical protein